MAYGDKRALDGVDGDNIERCAKAVQISADEVYRAHLLGQVPTDAFKALDEVPTLESARDTQELKPLITFDNTRRDIEDRKNRPPNR